MNLLTRRAARCSAAAALCALVLPHPAAAAQRYAAPDSTDRLGTCSALAPCRLDWAITGAAAGDEVIIAPGAYTTAPISTSTKLNVHGAAGAARPRIFSDSGTAAALSFKGGSAVAHLLVSASHDDQDAMTLDGGTGADLVLVSRDGDGAKINGTPAGTVLRDSVARVTGDGRGLVLKDGNNGSGSVELRNVTAVGDGGGSTGIASQMSHGTPTLRNVVARGGSYDLEGEVSNARLVAEYSNFRPAMSMRYTEGAGNQSADPRFADVVNGDYRPLGDSPTIDAGATDALLGGFDPEGNARFLGAAPDIGAFEWTGSSPRFRVSTALAAGGSSDNATTGGEAAAPAAPGAGTAPDPAAEQPKAGRSVSVVPASGVVKVKAAGGNGFQTLRAGDVIPVGSTVDARQGTVRLVSVRDTAGTLQAGVFSKGVFRITQVGRQEPLTVVTLVGGDFGRCRRPARGTAVAAAKRRDGADVVRQLWGRDKGGRFRSDGRFAAGTLRGTVWVTQDRCDGTLTRVLEGAVSVYDKRRHRRVLVQHGHSYLAKAPR